MIREAIDAVVAGRSLSMKDASSVMREIMEGEATHGQMGALFTALHIKGETVDEIAGMATVMREKALRVNVDGNGTLRTSLRSRCGARTRRSCSTRRMPRRGDQQELPDSLMR